MRDPLQIRPARAADASALTDLAFRSKAHWGYPAHWLELWRDHLTFSAGSIAEQHVRVAESAGRIVGVVALSWDGEGAEIEHLWVDPSALRQGIGRSLLQCAIDDARALGLAWIGIDADPHAEDFYLRMGARRVGAVPSTPAGRELPRLVLDLSGSR